MANVKVCDNCNEIFREEGKWCKSDHIVFEHKQFHLGDGMYTPWKKIKREFCSQKCFDEWYGTKYEE